MRSKTFFGFYKSGSMELDEHVIFQNTVHSFYGSSTMNSGLGCFVANRRQGAKIRSLTWSPIQTTVARCSRTAGDAPGRLAWRSGRAGKARKTIESPVSLQSRDTNTSISAWERSLYLWIFISRWTTITTRDGVNTERTEDVCHSVADPPGKPGPPGVPG